MKIAQQKELLGDCLDNSLQERILGGSRMLDGTRPNSPTGAGRVAAGQRLAATVTRLSPRNLWHSCNRARIRLIASCTPANRSVPVRNLVTLLGGIIALITALSIPVGYGIIGYFKEADALTYKAELSAARAAQYIYAPDAPWKYDTDQLAAMSEIRTTTAAPIVQRILDARGAIMMQKGDLLAWPTFARRAPIFAAGAKVGMAEVSASLRPLLAEVAWVGFGALVLAVAAYFAFTLLPLGALDRTLAELKNTNDRFRHQNLLLDTALENMVQGLAMYDAEARVVIANDRYAELYGMDPAHIRPGTTLREIVEQRLAKGHYAGWSADRVVREMGERVASKQVSRFINKLADGRTIASSVQPRADGGWVVTLEDITEREALNSRLARQNKLLKQREEELETQNTRFNAAINNMSQGLCLFNGEQRVMFANQRFAEIYNLDPEQVKPGTSLRQILEARVARGAYRNLDGAKFIADGVASFGREVSQILHLADGRFISVLRRPMPGGGVVSTHEDITEREKLKARLEQQNEQLDAAMNNMSQGLAMYDADQRLVICNNDYAAMYGLAPDQVQRGTTAREVLEARLANGCYITSNPHQLVDKLISQFGKIASEVHELADGRTVNVSCRQTANGGHVITHQDITDRRRSEAKIAHMALHDALTDLPNRVLLNERLEHAVTRVRRGEMVAVHLLDLDHFKTVNDTLGHPARWVSGSPWMTSARAIPRSAICRASPSTRSRSTARS
jgi:PAS domain-containing protein